MERPGAQRLAQALTKRRNAGFSFESAPFNPGGPVYAPPNIKHAFFFSLILSVDGALWQAGGFGDPAFPAVKITKVNGLLRESVERARATAAARCGEAAVAPEAAVALASLAPARRVSRLESVARAVADMEGSGAMRSRHVSKAASLLVIRWPDPALSAAAGSAFLL